MPRWKSKDIVWAAGFYEGEGSVGERSVLISQKNRWPLEKLLIMFGGHIGPIGKDGCYQWSLCGQAGRDFIKKIYPLLSPRRQEQINTRFLTDKKLLERKKIFKAQRSIDAYARSRNERGQFA